MDNDAKILVIDDDESMRDSCEQVFSVSGYRVETAENGDVGLEKHVELSPDIVLLDLKMPGKSGLDVLQELRQSDPECIVIVITGFGTIETAVEAMKLGAYDFISKPFTPDEIRIVVNRGLDWRRKIQEADRLRSEKEEMRNNFVSMVSHELKSPLAAAMQNLMALNSGAIGDLPDPAQEMLDRIQTRIQGLLSLIKDWLDLTRIESGEMDDAREPVDISVLVGEVFDALKAFAEEMNVKLEFDKPKSFPYVHGYRSALLMLLMNLVNNGIKYNDEKGSVRVELKEDVGEVTIVVRDTGIGISEEKLPHVFEQFYRTKDKRNVEGSGLGLSIVKRLTELHSGTVDVSSMIGEGSEFHVCLPIQL